MSATHAGMTTDEFSELVRIWLSTAQQPKLRVALHEGCLSAQARSAHLSSLERVLDVYRFWLQRGVHSVDSHVKAAILAPFSASISITKILARNG